ncbi:MAG: neutral zinc metallopeptidase [Mycobacteriales bacterium]
MSAARARPMLLAAAALLLSALLLSALLAGCAVGVDSGGGGASSGPTDQVDADSLAGDERAAVGATDAFWRQDFPDVFGRSYRSPQVKGGYRGSRGPSCGGEPPVPFNAFYCPSQDFLAWDQELMAAGYRQIGDAWVYLIIAHEWGHAIQARLQRDQVSVAAELQADCLAGATIFGAARRGLVQLEPGDTDELARTLAAVADDYPWTKESDHGDARERIAAFNRGADRGVKACIAS